jgi:antitoxin (DNA-binding transcriptional repressor) of toxin-antitoxin stability system
MRAVTIKEAKAHLNELIEAAIAGETVVLMRGATHVAAIVPITEDDLELSPRLTDDQAARLWKSLAAEQAASGVATFDSPAQAVEHLRRQRRGVARRSSRR